MILNPIICENCKRELQPENIRLGTNDVGILIRVCEFCGNVEAVMGEKDVKG